jgi:uncharacterized membrane protein
MLAATPPDDLQLPLRVCVAAVLAAALAPRGLKRRALAPSGAVAAFFVGLATMSASYTCGCILILFYLTSSKVRHAALGRAQPACPAAGAAPACHARPPPPPPPQLTKLRQERKQQLEECFKANGQRDAAQVLSNSAGGVAAALAARWAPALAAGPAEAAALRWAAGAAFLVRRTAATAGGLGAPLAPCDALDAAGF